MRPDATRPSRVARRAAERKAERRRTRDRRRVVAALVAAMLVGGGVAVFVVAARRHPARAAAERSSNVAVQSTSAPASSTQSRPALQGAYLTDPDQATSFLAGATSDLAAVTSYDYRHLDDALSVGLAVSTGAFKASYQAALTGPVAVDAKQQHVVQSFQLINAGIGSVSSDGSEAKVLVFGVQARTDDATHGQPRMSLVTLTATIDKLGAAYLVSALDTDGTNAGLPPGSVDLAYAAEAGRAEVVNVLSYQRGDFAADEQRALDGATGALATQIRSTATSTRTAMQHGHYDLSGAVTAIAVERAQGATATLLVAATAYQVDDQGMQDEGDEQRYEVTVVQQQGRWVASAITPVRAA